MIAAGQDIISEAQLKISLLFIHPATGFYFLSRAKICLMLVYLMGVLLPDRDNVNNSSASIITHPIIFQFGFRRSAPGNGEAVWFQWPVHSLLNQPTGLAGCAQHGDARHEAPQLSGEPGWHYKTLLIKIIRELSDGTTGMALIRQNTPPPVPGVWEPSSSL